MRRLLGGTTIVALALWVSLPLGAAREESLDRVLKKTEAYVVQFETQLAGIVGEETYTQEAREPNPDYRFGGRVHTRVLTSDLLLVRPIGGDAWVQFRDVFRVDDQPVHDRNDRLAALFLNPSRSSHDQAARIVAESARYNIGNVERTINVPVLPLLLLTPAHRANVRFKRQIPRRPTSETVSPEGLPSTASFRVRTEVWTIDFKENKSDTLVRTVRYQDLPLSGRLWVEPDTGRVLMGELEAHGGNVRAKIAVSYQSEPLLGLLVPVEMHESYKNEVDGSVITGIATYSRFRRFDVSVDQSLSPVTRQK